MRFSRARYVTLCQQSLVTAAVLAVGVSAAGVKTLDIVPQPGATAGAADRSDARSLEAVAPLGERPEPTEVDAAPVTPKVREIKVAGLAAEEPPAAREEAGDSQESARRAPGAKRLVALSEPQPVNGYATVGVTWKRSADYSEDQIDVQVRSEKNGRWSSWIPAAYDGDHAPDAADEAEGRPGTDALVIGDVDRVQMRAETTDGSTPPDLKLAVIDPGTGAMKKAAPAIDTADLPAPSGARTEAAGGADGADDTATLSAMRTAPKPQIYSRAQWGANEKMRESGPPGYGTIKAGFIHHTVNANNYSSAQVPALMRGIYAYHTQSRGWRDLGYNFIVDRFGRIWEGRYGGVSRAVVGAHTSGYNEQSFAMSALGNYETASPPSAVLNAYAKLFAWKLSMYNIRADDARVYVKNKYFKAISGHRDAGSTACPGRYLYAKLPSIRTATQKLQNAAQQTTPPPAPEPKPEPPSNVFTTPTQRSRPAVKQPSMAFPRTLNLAGDANPDLVLRSRSGAVTVLPTGGQTGYRAVASTPGKWSTMDLVAAVGDVTGDGRGDVVARLAKDRVTRVYAGDGAGRFAVPGTSATSAFKDANLLAGAGDWNRDGRSDVMMRDAKTGYLWLVPGRGNGKFGTRVLLSRYAKPYRHIVVMGDVSGDKRPELVAMHPNGYLYVARSTTSVAPSGFVKTRNLGAGYDEVVGADRDLSGDGLGDLVIRSKSSGALKVLVGQKSGFGRALGPFGVGSGYGSLSGGQVVGSAHPDVVAVNKAGTALVTLAHNGRVNLKPMLKGNLARADIMRVYNVGDWNGDGKGDVITRQGKGDSLVLRPGRGDGTFAAGSHMSKGGWKSFSYLAAVGDVTGDRDPDLIGRTSSGIATIFPGNGAKGFEAPIRTPWDVRTFNQIGSGVWKTRAFLKSAYLGSDGSFVPSLASGAGRLKGYDWVLGPGDLDGDDRNDLVGRDSAGMLWLLPGTSTGHGARRYLGSGFGGYTAAG